jgi:class 3 adenylate cyclase
MLPKIYSPADLPTAPFPIPGAATNAPFVERVILPPGGAFEAAGLRVGDLVDARQLSAAERYRWFVGAWRSGERVQLPVLRDGITRRVPASIEADSLTWNSWLIPIGTIWMLLFATLIAWRRPESAEARTLALLLVLFNIGNTLFPFFWITPWPALDATVAVLAALPTYMGVALLARYAMYFARPSPLRRLLAWLSYAMACILVLYSAAYVVGVWTLTADPAQAWYSGALPEFALGVFPYLFAFLCVLVAAAETRGADRARIVWVSASLAPLYLSFVASGTLGAFDQGIGIAVVLYLIGAGTFIAPLGLTYTLLNRHILGVGFALNRAMVLSAVSLVVVGAFVLVEWVLGGWLGTASRTTNFAATAAVAAALALSLRFIYTRIDGLVDTVFFRRQHEARAFVSRLIAGLPYAESAGTIADTLTRNVCESSQISSGALFQRETDGAFRSSATHACAPEEQIPQADIQGLALSFEGTPALLRLPDDAAFTVGVPFYVRRQLAGFVLYSDHTDGTALDPDERALLVELGAAASRGYDALELAARVEKANEARIRAQAESLESLKAYSEACERFVPGEFLKFLDKESLVGVRLGDHVLREMTVLFSDIRSFTSISERMTPKQIFDFLNGYLHRIGPLIRENGGFIDKYIGDAVMGLFPARPDDALRAAIALQREVRLFNHRLEDSEVAPIAVGVGLHRGELMLGTIGERGRMDTTVIADAVNVAARLETATKLYRCSIILSRQTVDALAEPDRFMLRPLGTVRVKGKERGIEIYECYDADPADLALHKRSTYERFVDALAAYEAGDLTASHKFSAILAGHTTDGAAAYFLEQCSTSASKV